jgi:hypothetical protein
MSIEPNRTHAFYRETVEQLPPQLLKWWLDRIGCSKDDFATAAAFQEVDVQITSNENVRKLKTFLEARKRE